MDIIKIDSSIQKTNNFQFDYIGYWALVENGRFVLVDKDKKNIVDINNKVGIQGDRHA